MHVGSPSSIVCFSHLRWSFVFQRPHHLLSRLAQKYDVYFIEEPVEAPNGEARMVEEHVSPGVTVVRPRLPSNCSKPADSLRDLILSYLSERRVIEPILWYYTPLALEFTADIPYSLCVYDCMDELSLFAFAPAGLAEWERALFERADIVFAGGKSLYYSKRKQHKNVNCFPSAVDRAHFAPRGAPEPVDLAGISHPRFGFYGVVDERFDVAYLGRLAELRPDWNFVVLGPVVKIDPASLPVRPNLHYIGNRSYDELPAYLEHWDVAMLPFANNDATRFISPTKTLEYLAAYKPVISTPIADVVDPYGIAGLVGIARTPEEFVRLAEETLKRPMPAAVRAEVDALVERLSWDATVRAMSGEIERLIPRLRLVR